MWSVIEPGLVWLNNGAVYTSLAQLLGNLLYIPFLLDVYGSRFLDNKVVYIMLFPLNIWLLELVLGRLFVLVLGRNVAWCYCEEPHAAFNGTLRWSHCV